jgi:hypothetical protein
MSVYKSPFIIQTPKGPDSLLLEDGTYPARGLYLIDAGLQDIAFQGAISTHRQVIIGWEVYPQAADTENPVKISRRFTFSLGKRANLRKILEAWLGKIEDGQEFNVSDVLDSPCLVQVQNVVFTGDTGEEVTYAKVVGVSKPPKGYIIPELKGTPFVFSVDPVSRDMEIFHEHLSERQQKYVMQARNWNAPPMQPTPEIVDDEIPF